MRDSVEPMSRPLLTHVTSAEELLRWYWLKEELIQICRRHKIPSSGTKPELTARIAAHFSGKPLRSAKRVLRKAEMPSEFGLETRISEGWRCTPALGAFLRSQCGRTFRFNKPVRDFIHSGMGHKLSEVVEVYRQSVKPDAPKLEIPPQLEYNRHTREYYASNPGAKREEVLAAWWTKRGARRA